MPKENNKILKYNHGKKSMKVPFIIYPDMECILSGFSTGDDNTKYYKVRDHCHYTGKYRRAAHNICNLSCKTPKEIHLVFHNGSTCDYHFIIKELAEEFEGQFECLGENTEKYITFLVPIKKELDHRKSIKHKIMFIDSFRFM